MPSASCTALIADSAAVLLSKSSSVVVRLLKLDRSESLMLPELRRTLSLDMPERCYFAPIMSDCRRWVSQQQSIGLSAACATGRCPTESRRVQRMVDALT